MTIDIKDSSFDRIYGIKVDRCGRFSAKINIMQFGISFKVGGRNSIKLEEVNDVMRALNIDMYFINTGLELIY